MPITVERMLLSVLTLLISIALGDTSSCSGGVGMVLYLQEKQVVALFALEVGCEVKLVENYLASYCPSNCLVGTRRLDEVHVHVGIQVVHEVSLRAA